MRKDAVNLARVGILLPLGAIIPYIGVLFSLAGAIVLLIAYNKLSKVFEDKDIFKYYLTSFIISIISVVFGMGLFFGGVFGTIFSAQDFSGDPNSVVENLMESPEIIFSGGLTITGIIIFIVGWILSGFFYFKSNSVLSVKTGENMFKTAGIL
ncbi:MAG: DUF996 domain-containing protein, partial [Flavobacteriales bacterium]